MAQVLEFFRSACVSNKAVRSLLPAGTKHFLYLRMMEVSGFVLAIGVVAIAVALFSYVLTDPSFNNTTGTLSANPLGTAGAAIAGLLIQAFGKANYVPPIGIGVWGFRLIAKRPVLHPLCRASHKAPSALTNRTKASRSSPRGSA